MGDSPPKIVQKPIREWLRKRGEPIAQDVALQDRGDDVRMTLLRAAYEQYDDVPESVTQWYDPEENVVVIELPEPDTEQNNTLSDYGNI